MRMTPGVTASAMFTKASLRSSAGWISASVSCGTCVTAAAGAERDHPAAEAPPIPRANAAAA